MIEYMIDNLEIVMRSIEEARRISIEEFEKTDLNECVDISSVCKWYDSLAKAVKSKPPLRKVRTLEIIEDEDENILETNYDYNDGSAERKISFRIITRWSKKEEMRDEG